MKVEEESSVDIKFPSRHKTGEGTGREEKRVRNREGVRETEKPKEPSPSRGPHQAIPRV